jgi:hypothetical protein
MHYYISLYMKNVVLFQENFNQNILRFVYYILKNLVECDWFYSF